MDFFFVRLKPDELEEDFRLQTIARDKTQIIIVMAITLMLIVGFIALDRRFIHDDSALRISIMSRCVASVASLVAIWMIHRGSDPRSVDRITVVWMLIDIGHLLIVNAVRPTDYVPVVVWDLLTIFGIYFFVPIPVHFQMMSAFLLTGNSVALWVIYKIPLAGEYETLAVL
jgi:hypothetical protein